MKNNNMETYRDLKNALDRLSESQLDQSIQIMPPNSNGDKPTELWHGFHFDTVEALCGDIQLTRSPDDNCHHPEQYVLMVDYNPYSEDGDTFYTLNPETDKWTGNVTGNEVD